MEFQAEDGLLSGAVIDDLHSGAEEGLYVDFQNPSDDFLEWQVEANTAGTQPISIRYALGASERTMSLEVNGDVVFPQLTFSSTGAWSNWEDLEAQVDLNLGINTVRIVATGDSGPNVDSLTLNPISEPPGNPPSTGDDMVRINFQATGADVPDGYVADTGLAFDSDRGFGWVTEATVGSTNPTPVDVSGTGRDRNVAGFDQRLDTLVHMQLSGFPDGGWEYELDNGEYVVTAALGDNSNLDSTHRLNIEGQTFAPSFSPSTTSPFTLVTGTVAVSDGRLSLDAIGGSNTKLNYLEFEAIDPEQPTFGGVFDGNDELLNQETGIDPEASFAIGVNIESPDDAIEQATVSESTVKLLRTRDLSEVAGTANTTGGRDSISFSPTSTLEGNTQYTLVVDGVTNEAGDEYVPISRTFTTSSGEDGGPSTEIEFSSSTVDSGKSITSLTVSPDNQYLYAASLESTIYRWSIDQQTGALSNEQSFDIGGANGPRALIGLTFDPNDSNRLWITNNDTIVNPPADNYTGKISYLDIADGDAFSATLTDYVTGLPRSIRDHISNSLAFGPDGDLYLSQGSNSATGAPDNAWGLRPESLLSAAILRIDPNRTAPTGGFNVQTEDGGSYDPFAADAPVSVYASGVRNAYDLAWHSNGNLYVPTNGSAAGGNVPDDPSTLEDEGVENVSIQSDYLYNVQEGGYYGHPNPTRGEYILNGGNPTAGEDLAEVVAGSGRNGYDVGTQPDSNFRGVAYDFGLNRSPNGVIEYQSDAFGDALSGQLLVTEYSGGDRILGLSVNNNGAIVESRSIASGFDNPLDVIEHVPSGRLYVSELGGNAESNQITLLSPLAPPSTFA